MACMLTVHHSVPGGCPNEPVTLGVPFAAGALRDVARLALAGPDGAPRPLQARVLQTWADGSVRWALVHFLADLPATGPGQYQLRDDAAGRPPAALEHPLRVEPETARATIDTGVLSFEVDGGSFRGFERVQVRSRDGHSWCAVAEPATTGSLYAITPDDRLYSASWGRPRAFAIEERGPLMARVFIAGELADEEGHALLEYDLWLEAWAGQATVRAWLTLRNRRIARRRDCGLWPLGLPGSVYLREAGWRLAPAQSGVSYVTLHAGAEGEVYRGPFVGQASLVQDSSGGEHWFHRNHVNREGRIPLSYRGWKAFVDGTEVRQGQRAEAWIGVEDARLGVAAGVRHGWQNFPKALRVERTPDGRVELAVALWPRESADVHELQGGEQKTHELVFAFYRGDGNGAAPRPYAQWPETAARLARALQPPVAFAAGAQYQASGVFDHLGPYDPDHAPDYERAAQGAVVATPRNLFTCREEIDEFGWRNFGDVWADNEIGGRVLSHYNLEYDMGYAMLMQAVRTADARPDLALKWWELAEAALRHEADIDLYHCPDDPHNGGVYSGGKFTHTDHAFEPGTATHRTFAADGMAGDLIWPWGRGGGPESGHFNTRGMVTYGAMTGYQPAALAAGELAELVYRKIVTTNFAQYGFDRTSGHNLQVLLEAWHLDHAPRWLEAAAKIIDRSHPDQWPWVKGFPAAAGMSCWCGGIFLKETARYLELLEGQFGRSDERARSALLTAIEIYNRWAWDEAAGRFAHSVNPDGSHQRYASEAWWDLKVLEMVVWATRWQPDTATRELWLSRARRNFAVACAILAQGRNEPVYLNAKCVTVVGANGPGFLALSARGRSV